MKGITRKFLLLLLEKSECSVAILDWFHPQLNNIESSCCAQLDSQSTYQRRNKTIMVDQYFSLLKIDEISINQITNRLLTAYSSISHTLQCSYYKRIFNRLFKRFDDKRTDKHHQSLYIQFTLWSNIIATLNIIIAKSDENRLYGKLSTQNFFYAIYYPPEKEKRETTKSKRKRCGRGKKA